MAGTDLRLSHREWVEVARAFEQSISGAAAAFPTSGPIATLASWIARPFARASQGKTSEAPGTLAIRRFSWATKERRKAAEEYIPALVSCGFNLRQIEALPMLLVPDHTDRKRRTC